MIKRYVLVSFGFAEKPCWYIDSEDKATAGSIVKVDYGTYQDVRGVVMQVIRADKNYPPYKGRIKDIWEIIELK